MANAAPERGRPHAVADAPPPRSVSEQVRDHLETLTPSERRVARTLLAAYPIAVHGSDESSEPERFWVSARLVLGVLGGNVRALHGV